MSGEETMSDIISHSKFRDRDIIRDIDGRILVVLGYIQPTDQILAFLKYIPDASGKWASGAKRYRRAFWGDVDSVVDGIHDVPSEYVVNDSHFGTELIEVPIDYIEKHFLPEERLEEIRGDGPTDKLESQALGLANAIHDTLGISFSDLGVAGSILWKGHNPEFSDINMNVYGFENSWILKTSYESVSNADKVRLRKSDEWIRGVERILARVPNLSREDIDKLFERRFAFYYDNQCIGVTPVLRPEESPIQYGSESYQQISDLPITLTFVVEDSRYGLFSPSIVEGRSSIIDESEGTRISRLLIYEGIYNGLFKAGDLLEVTGTLQRVSSRRGNQDDFYQLMIGTKTGAGKEYIRLLNSP